MENRRNYRKLLSAVLILFSIYCRESYGDANCNPKDRNCSGPEEEMRPTCGHSHFLPCLEKWTKFAEKKKGNAANYATAETKKDAKEICREFKKAKKCANQVRDTCWDMPGPKDSDASKMIRLVEGSLDFVCGEGMDEYLKNFDCISKVNKESQEKMVKCNKMAEELDSSIESKFDLESPSGEAQSNLCSGAKKVINCLSAIYKSCGDNVEKHMERVYSGSMAASIQNNGFECQFLRKKTQAVKDEL